MSAEILFGFHPVAEALGAARRRFDEILIDPLKSGRRLKGLRAAADRRRIPVKAVSSDHLNALAKSVHHQGVAARVGAYPYSGVKDILDAAGRGSKAAFLLVLDSIVDPQNLGAIVRTALCAGVDGIVIPKDRSAAATAAVSRISAGALEHIRLARVTNLVRTVQQLKTKGLWIIGLAGQTPEDLYGLDLITSLALIIGAEERGLRPLLKKQCDFLAAIPMAGPLDSLNASAAAAVALYEVLRQRSAAKG